MPLPHIDANTLGSLLSMADAIDALRTAFAEPMTHVERLAIHAGTADLLVMPAVHGRFAGVKSIVVQPANAGTALPVIGGSYVLLDIQNATPLATFDGAALTGLRTPAISAIAADVLSPADVRSAAILGTGPQGVGHAAALQVIRPGIITALIGRNRTAAENQIIKAADVVITCTSSAIPVVTAADVRQDATVIAVGSYRPERAELAPDLVIGSEVWVDDRSASRAEAGDLHRAADAGWSWDDVRGDLHELLLRGAASGPAADGPGRAGRAVFKSVGLAAQDLIIASLAFSRLRISGIAE